MKQLFALSIFILVFSCKRDNDLHCRFANSTKVDEISLYPVSYLGRFFAGIKAVSSVNGQLASVDYLNGAKEVYTYNLNNQIVTFTTFEDAVNHPSNYIKDSNVYDASNHINRIYNYDSSSGIHRIDYVSYDSLGRISGRSFSTVGYSEIRTIYYYYDERGNYSKLIAFTGAGAGTEWNFIWDNKLNPLSMYGVKGNNPTRFSTGALASGHESIWFEFLYEYNKQNMPVECSSKFGRWDDLYTTSGNGSFFYDCK